MYNYIQRCPRKTFLITGIATLFLCALQLAGAQNVTLMWNANPEPNIAGYRLHYGTTTGTYTQVINVGNSTTATVSDLPGGIVYFFAVTASNTAGIESIPSNEVSYAAPGLTTPTPTPSPANTPTPTPASTVTPTPASTATPIIVSGNISYCPNPDPGSVPNVTLTLTGSASASILTDGSGNYQFSSLAAGGSYIVTPSMSALTPGSDRINAVDVLVVMRHYLEITPLPAGCQRAAADVNGNNAIDGSDVRDIQRFYLGFPNIPSSNVGKYQFTPTNRAYLGIVSSQTAQNYDTLVFGDVASSIGELPGTVATVALPEIAVDASVGNFIAQVTTTAIDENNDLVGFQGDFTFDERVVAFQSQPVQNAGITGGNWNVSANVLPGSGPIRTLRILAFSVDFTPLSGSGTLLELRMTRVGSASQGTQLTWAAAPNQFVFIDADLNTQKPDDAASGNITSSADTR